MRILKQTALLLALSGCASIQKQEAGLSDVQKMMESTVQIHVDVFVTAIVEGEEIPLGSMGWSGSGVVYDEKGGIIDAKHSMVLSANHVLETPAPGTVTDFMFGKLRVDAVMITAKSAANKVCELEVVALGENTEKDAAVAEANCLLAPPAPIAKRIPPTGAKLYIVGHPLGIPTTMVTEGFFSGWMEKYMVASAAIASGNSGGPVFYEGKIVGLAVRGTERYPNISIIAPLSEILKRIEEAK